MKRLIILVMVAFVFIFSNTVPLAAATVKHSEKRSEETRRGRKIQSGKEDKKKEKDNERRNSRDGNESQKSAKEKDGNSSSDESREFKQQLKALEEQMTHEQTKFSDRKTKLEQQKRQAKDKGDTETAERTEGLLKKEQHIYDKKMRNMDEKRQKILDLIERQAAEDANKPAK